MLNKHCHPSLNTSDTLLYLINTNFTYPKSTSYFRYYTTISLNAVILFTLNKKKKKLNQWKKKYMHIKLTCFENDNHNLLQFNSFLIRSLSSSIDEIISVSSLIKCKSSVFFPYKLDTPYKQMNSNKISGCSESPSNSLFLWNDCDKNEKIGKHDIKWGENRSLEMTVSWYIFSANVFSSAKSMKNK